MKIQHLAKSFLKDYKISYMKENTIFCQELFTRLQDIIYK